MMNIREYFNNLYNKANTTEEWEAVMEYEEATYEMFEEDTMENVELWAQQCNVDLQATQTVLGTPELVTTLWVWDMCGE